MINVFGKYCCLFTLYTELVYTPQQFVELFEAEGADRLTDRLFASEFGTLPSSSGGDGKCSSIFL